jgi:hypothetical protein
LSEKAKELGVETLDEVIRRLVAEKPAEARPPEVKEPYDPKAQRSRKRCAICGRPGHYATRCKKRDPTDPPKPRTCTKCGRPGHNIATCTSPEQVVRVKPDLPPPLTPEERKESYAEIVERKYPGLVARLGVETDFAIAKAYGVSRQRVHQIRQRMDIEASYEPPEFPEDVAPFLGTMPDTALAAKFDIPLGRVRMERAKRGISPFEYTPPVEEKINEVRHLVGEISDRKLAAQIGVHHADIFRFRQKYGIKTKVLSPQHDDFVPIDRAEVTRLFNEGKSDAEIAEAVGCSVGTVTGIRSRLGLLRKEAGIPLTEEEQARILKLRRSGKSYAFISRALDRPMATISTFVRRTKG